MKQVRNHSLKSFNTFSVDARAATYIRFDREKEVVDYCRSHTFGDRPWLVLGGGSNILFVDDFEGLVMHPQLKGIDVADEDRETVLVRVMAGENWDRFVEHAVARGWGGVENLSFIPGSVGASVVQNIGAYGVEVETVVHSVEAVSVKNGEKMVFKRNHCGFGYRMSNFKAGWKGRFIITAVRFRLNRQPIFALNYPGVEKAVSASGSVDLKSIRQAIIDIRKTKLPDPDKQGNAGSFFKNPTVGPDILKRLIVRYPGIPHFAHPGSRFKLSAGWMIERCGFKGSHLGRAAVHDRQALVLVNGGGATGKEILTLSQKVQEAVQKRFGICLEREVQVVPEVCEKLKKKTELG